MFHIAKKKLAGRVSCPGDAAADGLKVLDPKRPIREADIRPRDLDLLWAAKRTHAPQQRASLFDHLEHRQALAHDAGFVKCFVPQNRSVVPI